MGTIIGKANAEFGMLHYFFSFAVYVSDSPREQFSTDLKKTIFWNKVQTRLTPQMNDRIT